MGIDCTECKIDSFNCSECGIVFGISHVVAESWRKNHHSFVCPNGHSLSWGEKNAQEKELEKLREEVKALKEKLTAAEKKAEEQQKRADDLASKLEIWEPSENVLGRDDQEGNRA